MSAGPQRPETGDPTHVSGTGRGSGFPPPPPPPAPPGDPRFEGATGPPGYPPPPATPKTHPGHPVTGQHAGGRDRAAAAAALARRHLRTPEAEQLLRSSEFAVWLVVALLTLIAAAISDELGPRSAWLYVTILSSAYIVSRGLAKAGSRRADPEHQ